MTSDHHEQLSLKQKLYQIIFEANTPAGRRFDIVLLVVIVISIALVMLESIPSIKKAYGLGLTRSEWLITLLFPSLLCENSLQPLLCC